jgi:hypothetical protein
VSDPATAGQPGKTAARWRLSAATLADAPALNAGISTVAAMTPAPAKPASQPLRCDLTLVIFPPGHDQAGTLLMLRPNAPGPADLESFHLDNDVSRPLPAGASDNWRAGNIAGQQR